VRQHVAGHRHRRGAAADRADGDRGRSASRLDELQDVEHDDHDLLVVDWRFFVGLGFSSERLLGHVGVVRRDVERRRNGLERNQRFRLERRHGSDRRWRVSKRGDDALRRRHLGLRLDQRWRRPPLGQV
jgi:hypothetical protein